MPEKDELDMAQHVCHVKHMRNVIAASLLLLAAPAWAAWNVTDTWVESPGPNLDHTEVLADLNGDGTVTLLDPTCSIPAGNPATCTYRVEVAEANGQPVIVRSYSPEGAYSDYVIGPLTSTPVTGAASGGARVWVWVP